MTSKPSIATSVAALLSIESPMPEERIRAKNCCFMFRAEVDGSVEASIDGGAWKRCRHLMGYWWLDWESKKTGAHRVVARVKTPRGEDLRTEPRRFHLV